MLVCFYFCAAGTVLMHDKSIFHVQFSVLSDSMSSYFGSSSDGTPVASRVLKDYPKFSSSSQLTPKSQQNGKQPQRTASPMRPIFSSSPKRHIPEHEIHFKTQDGTTAVLPSGNSYKVVRTKNEQHCMHAHAHTHTHTHARAPLFHRWNCRLFIRTTDCRRYAAAFCSSPNDQLRKQQQPSDAVHAEKRAKAARFLGCASPRRRQRLQPFPLERRNGDCCGRFPRATKKPTACNAFCR